MAVAAALVVSEPQRAIFTEIFRKAKTDQYVLGLPPHMSFAVFDEIDVTLLENAIKRFVKETQPLQVTMSSIAMFPTEQPVVYAVPTVNAALLDAQRRFHHELSDLSHQCWDYYKPDLWSPHLTLGGAGSLASALQIMSVAYEAKLRGSYLFESMAVIEFPPVRIISTHKFCGSDRA